LTCVRKELNAFFRTTQGDREVVVLAPPSDQLAGAGDDTNNRILCTLTNVLQEATLRNQLGAMMAHGVRAPPPLSINLHVLFAAHYTDYVTGLDFLTDVIAFLQAKPSFDRNNAPELDPRVEKITLSLMNLEYSEMSHLWGMFGAPYRPSALYEMRMLPLRDPRRPSGAAPSA
jgi:hypothetical protein